MELRVCKSEDGGSAVTEEMSYLSCCRFQCLIRRRSCILESSSSFFTSPNATVDEVGDTESDIQGCLRSEDYHLFHVAVYVRNRHYPVHSGAMPKNTVAAQQQSTINW